jgi:hypothetical protein
METPGKTILKKTVEKLRLLNGNTNTFTTQNSTYYELPFLPAPTKMVFH